MIPALLTVFSKLDGQRRFVAPLLPAPLEAQTPKLGQSIWDIIV